MYFLSKIVWNIPPSVDARAHAAHVRCAPQWPKRKIAGTHDPMAIETSGSWRVRRRCPPRSTAWRRLRVDMRSSGGVAATAMTATSVRRRLVGERRRLAGRRRQAGRFSYFAFALLFDAVGSALECGRLPLDAFDRATHKASGRRRAPVSMSRLPPASGARAPMPLQKRESAPQGARWRYANIIAQAADKRNGPARPWPASVRPPIATPCPKRLPDAFADSARVVEAAEA
jgi:hypothetical protein